MTTFSPCTASSPDSHSHSHSHSSCWARAAPPRAIPVHPPRLRPCPRATSTIRAHALPRVVLQLTRTCDGLPCAAFPLVELAFGGATIYALTVVLAMLLTIPGPQGRILNTATGARLPPRSRLRRFLASHACVVPLALTYAVLLLCSWQPDTISLVLPGSLQAGLANGWNPQFFPSLVGICTLFSRHITAASLWVHVLAVNVAAARWVYLQGVDGRVSRLTAALGVTMCAVFAPVGIVGVAWSRAQLPGGPEWSSPESTC